jgi:PIN domain nuclease of toxin-antitoxin system
MRLLLDTHAFLQLCRDPALLPAKARDADRMLIAQARSEGLHLVTGDDKIRAYSVDIVWD